MADDSSLMGQSLLAHPGEDELWDRAEAAPPAPASPEHGAPTCADIRRLVGGRGRGPAEAVRLLQRCGVRKVAEFEVEVGAGCWRWVLGPGVGVALTPAAAAGGSWGLVSAEGAGSRFSRGWSSAGVGTRPCCCRSPRRWPGCALEEPPPYPTPPPHSTPQDRLALGRIGQDSIATLGLQEPGSAADHEAAWRRELGAPPGGAPPGAAAARGPGGAGQQGLGWAAGAGPGSLLGGQGWRRAPPAHLQVAAAALACTRPACSPPAPAGATCIPVVAYLVTVRDAAKADKDGLLQVGWGRGPTGEQVQPAAPSGAACRGAGQLMQSAG